MNRQALLQAFLGACLALSVGGLAAQTPATSDSSSATATSQDKSNAQAQTPAQQQPSTSSKHAKAKKSSHHASKTASSKTASSKTKSHQHVAKSSHGTASAHGAAKTKSRPDETMTTPDESAYRQALRGCVTQQEQSQRDSCIDQTIQKFGRNA